MKKQEMLELLETMPEEIDIDQLMYTLHVRRKLELGAADDQADLVISDEALATEEAEWRA